MSSWRGTAPGAGGFGSPLRCASTRSLDLRVVRGKAAPSPGCAGNESPADFAAPEGANRDILKIGIAAAQSPGRGHRLVERGVHSTGGLIWLSASAGVDVGRFELLSVRYSRIARGSSGSRRAPERPRRWSNTSPVFRVLRPGLSFKVSKQNLASWRGGELMLNSRPGEARMAVVNGRAPPTPPRDGEEFGDRRRRRDLPSRARTALQRRPGAHRATARAPSAARPRRSSGSIWAMAAARTQARCGDPLDLRPAGDAARAPSPSSDDQGGDARPATSCATTSSVRPPAGIEQVAGEHRVERESRRRDAEAPAGERGLFRRRGRAGGVLARRQQGRREPVASPGAPRRLRRSAPGARRPTGT